MNPHRSDPDPVSTVLGSIVGTFSVTAFAFLAGLGFTGGTVPLAGWELPGGLLPGLAWLLALGSVGLIVLWFVPLMASMAVYSVLTWLRPAVIYRHHRPARLGGRARPSRQAA